MQTLMGLLGRDDLLGAPSDRFFSSFTIDRKKITDKNTKWKIRLAGIYEMHLTFHLKKKVDLNGI